MYKKKPMQVKCPKCSKMFISEHSRSELITNRPKGHHGGRFISKEQIYEVCPNCLEGLPQ